MAFQNNVNLSPLQIFRAKSGYVSSEMSTIANMFAVEPEKMESIISQATGMYSEKNVLDIMTSGLGNVEYIDGDEYQWGVMVSPDLFHPVSKVSANPSQLGQAGSLFELYFSTQCFTEGQTIRSAKGIDCVVTGPMLPDGGHYVVRLRLKDKNQPAIPASEIALGARWTGSYTAVPENSDYGGDIEFSTNALLRNRITKIRNIHDVTADAARTKLVISLGDPRDSKTFKIWAEYAEWEFWKKFRRDINDMLLKGIASNYSTETVNSTGVNGRPVFEGAGLEQQLLGANKYYYNGTLDFSYLERILESLCNDYSAYGEGKEFTLVTGRAGARVLNEMIERKQASQAFTVIDSSYFYSNLEGNMKEYKDPQFKRIRFFNGIVLNIVINPHQDAKCYQHFRHPKTGYPVESYKMMIFRNRASDGKSNIRQVIKRGEETVATYVNGTVSPNNLNGSATWKQSSSHKDGYSLSLMTKRGVKVADPTGAAMLVLNI